LTACTPSIKKKAPAGSRGFTLLEILVVLGITGFLIAMAAPRFAGFTAQASDTTGRTDEARLIGQVTCFRQDSGHYPGGLINVVSRDEGTGEYLKPMVSDQDPDTGVEVLSLGADQRCRFRLHYLSDAEAAELRSLGIIHVYNLNSRHDRNIVSKGPVLQKVDAGTAMLMIGGGDSDGDGIISAPETDVTEPGWGAKDLQFRLVLGLGPESDLVQRGYVFNAPACPAATTRPVNYDYKWYSLVLPRLSATRARLLAHDPLGGGSHTAYHLDSRSRAAAAALDLVKQRAVNLYESQDPAFFTIINSEGEEFHPSEAEGYWGLDFNGDGHVGI
jgi:prepilin-type N-terminal cleavage/methylation domain-containing protein